MFQRFVSTALCSESFDLLVTHLFELWMTSDSHVPSSMSSALPLRTLFWSKTAGVTWQEHADETKKFWQSNFRHELAWTRKQDDVSPARVINADETCVRLLPARTYGWSPVGSKASQGCASKAAIIGTLAPPRHGCRGSAAFQAYFRGQSGRVQSESRRSI